jgi:chemotaxis signal transduction protein
VREAEPDGKGKDGGEGQTLRDRLPARGSPAARKAEGKTVVLSDWNLVLLQLPEMAVGLAVGNVEGIEAVARRAVEQASVLEAPRDSLRLVRGLLSHGGRVVNLVDANATVETIFRLNP